MTDKELSDIFKENEISRDFRKVLTSVNDRLRNDTDFKDILDNYNKGLSQKRDLT